MICDKCKKNPATVHFTQVLNGEKVQQNLCQVCAANEAPMGFNNDWGVFNILNSMLSGEVHKGRKAQPAAELRCDLCGTTWPQVQKHGFLGCSKCYSTFDSFIDQALTRIHGTSQHSGKILKRRGDKIKLARSIEKLKQELQSAVRLEEFEKAAELRDKIRAIEDSVKKEG